LVFVQFSPIILNLSSVKTDQFLKMLYGWLRVLLMQDHGLDVVEVIFFKQWLRKAWILLDKLLCQLKKVELAVEEKQVLESFRRE
jgi:hypothetical protein